MSNNIVLFKVEIIKEHIKELVCSSVTTISDDVTLLVNRLKGISFETVIIERYRSRKTVWRSLLSRCSWQIHPFSV